VILFCLRFIILIQTVPQNMVQMTPEIKMIASEDTLVKFENPVLVSTHPERTSVGGLVYKSLKNCFIIILNSRQNAPCRPLRDHL
jgi:hypothetical protein